MEIHIKFIVMCLVIICVSTMGDQCGSDGLTKHNRKLCGNNTAD